RYRIGAFQNWFSDPKFMNGRDSVIMTAESKSLVSRVVANLPQIIEVEIPSPNQEARKHFISWFNGQQPGGKKIQLWGTEDELAKSTAALSIHALMQLLKGSCYEVCYEGKKFLEQKDVIIKVQDFIKSQLGGKDEDIVEFEKPTDITPDDVVGYRNLKKFFAEELIPWFNKTGRNALSGIGVCGPIGSGKTFQFKAVASVLGRVVLVLKNFRSMWFGESDVKLERLKRILYALDKALVFVDEADTAFGGVSKETHETERRLTGKIQAMMSDNSLRGKVVWLLMTARIHLLSPDMRRPGRLDMIIPILDPEGEDRTDFLKWVLGAAFPDYKEEDIKALDEFTKGYSAASFDVIRRRLIGKAEEAKDKKLAIEQIKKIINNYVQPAIGDTRRYQTLQALINCTEKSLLPSPDTYDDDRKKWEAEIRLLEAKGITGD
ncbi:ATP-binding protein, partial [Candidatus Pacearchaeota archaeon]|nr:ATP-binding protein [Candidatus Pacearchaeota archaeon]